MLIVVDEAFALAFFVIEKRTEQNRTSTMSQYQYLTQFSGHLLNTNILAVLNNTVNWERRQIATNKCVITSVHWSQYSLFVCCLNNKLISDLD